MVGRAQGWCMGWPGVSVGLARRWLRCRGAVEHGGWRGGELRVLEVGDGLESVLAVDGMHGRRVPGGLVSLLGVVRRERGQEGGREWR